MKPPLFSIVTVVRNDAVGLAATGSSVKSQTCERVEWIIVDGNSTDSTRGLALSYADTTTKVVSEPDKGIYDAMNKGLHLATGEYVVLMNAGDLFADSDVLKKVAGELARRPLDVLYCGSIMDFGVARVVRRPKPLWYILHGQPGLHQATVFRRETHLSYLYDCEYRICGDYDTITRMWTGRLRFGRCHITMSVNEFDAASASSKRKIALLREACQIQKRNLALNTLVIALSASYRGLSSLAAKVLTTARAWQDRSS